MSRRCCLAATLAVLTLVLGTGCGGGADSAAVATADTTDVTPATHSRAGSDSRKPALQPREYVPQPSIYVNAVSEIEMPVVVLHTSAGDIKIELEIEKSPKTVLNFLENYVRSGFYDQTIIHYVDADSFVMAGGFTTNLELKPTSSPIYNESNNGLSNVRGSVAMSRDAESAHSATSQFFINVKDNTDLDYQGSESDSARGYCVFGRVIEGMEVVDQIAQGQVRVEGDFGRLPVETIVIESIEEL